MQDNMQEKEEFNIVKRAKSFTHAFRGIRIFVSSTPNVRIHFAGAIIAIVLGFTFNISKTEWFAIIFASGIVIIAEAFNTAIEIDIDLTSPEYHPYARETKDVSAGAVLIASMLALIIGLIVFLPYIYALL